MELIIQFAFGIAGFGFYVKLLSLVNAKMINRKPPKSFNVFGVRM